MEKPVPKSAMSGERAKELANNHWQYIKTVLTAHFGASLNTEYLSQLELHYVTAMIHGYKHGWADRDGLH